LRRPYQRCVRSSLPSARDARPWAWKFQVRHSRADRYAGDEQVSQVPGEPWCRHARFLDPGGIAAPGQSDAATRPPYTTTTWAPASSIISRLNSRALPTRCLRFVLRVAPGARKTRFRLLARLYRVGLNTHRVPPKGFRFASCFASSFPRLSPDAMWPLRDSGTFSADKQVSNSSRLGQAGASPSGNLSRETHPTACRRGPARRLVKQNSTVVSIFRRAIKATL
jgi:hypothetical protein